MNKQLHLHVLAQLRDTYKHEHLDTEAEALDAAIQALDNDALEDAYAHGYTEAEAKFRAIMDQKQTDCISREVVQNWLENEWDGIVAHVFDGIKNLPSAQPEPQWIPRSSTERPKDREEVMVTIDDGYQRYTDTDEYVNGYFWYHDDKHIVAWKSFDEPWRGEEHGQDD